MQNQWKAKLKRERSRRIYMSAPENPSRTKTNSRSIENGYITRFSSVGELTSVGRAAIVAVSGSRCRCRGGRRRRGGMSRHCGRRSIGTRSRRRGRSADCAASSPSAASSTSTCFPIGIPRKRMDAVNADGHRRDLTSPIRLTRANEKTWMSLSSNPA